MSGCEAVLNNLQSAVPALPACEHRTVAADGRIVCRKIAWGEAEVSPGLCRACPAQAADCVHLRFALRHVACGPLVVRYNGRTEVWPDEAPALRFERAACALQILPLPSARPCAACVLRQPLAAAPTRPARSARPGRVVPFPAREPGPAHFRAAGDQERVARVAER